MLGKARFLFPLFPLVFACSSESPAPPPEPPVWTDAPTSIDVYEGRATDVPFSIKGDPKTAHLEPTAEGALEVEVIADEAPSTDGLVRGKLRVRAGYKLADLKLTVDVVAGAQKTTVPIALKTHALKWKKHSWAEGAGPPALEHGTFIFDAETSSAFLLHGSGYKPQWKPVEESWKLESIDGAPRWSAWQPAGEAVPGGAARRVATVPEKKIAYVHGGYTGFQDTETTVGDLYRVDLADPSKTITKINGGDPASTARSLHALAYDPTGDQLVVFGGVTEIPFQMILDDTWLVKVDGDSAAWTPLESKKKPDGRYGAFTAFDAESRRFIVWSGARTPESGDDLVNAAQDAWALDLAAEPPVWTKVEFEGPTPPGRRNGCAMHDPIGRRLFVFGGTKNGRTTEHGLWVLSLEPGREKWTKLDIAGAPPPRSSGFGFTMPDGAVACGFGNDDKAYADVNLLGYFD